MRKAFRVSVTVLGWGGASTVRLMQCTLQGVDTLTFIFKGRG